jgi:hypothetical protein
MSRSAVWWENHLWRSQLPCIPDWGLLFICYQIPIIFFFLCHASPKSSCWYIYYIFILSSGSTCSPPPVDNKLSHTSNSILTPSASDCFNHGNPSHTAVDEMKTSPHHTKPLFDLTPGSRTTKTLLDEADNSAPIYLLVCMLWTLFNGFFLVYFPHNVFLLSGTFLHIDP